MPVSKGTLPRSDHRAKRPSNKGSDVAPRAKEVDKSTYSGRVAARVRELRDAEGWTVADLCERVNRRLSANGLKEVGQSTVHGWDNGSRKIDPDLYPLLAKIFKLTVPEFLPPA